jgi:hypothetical protein
MTNGKRGSNSGQYTRFRTYYDSIAWKEGRVVESRSI